MTYDQWKTDSGYAEKTPEQENEGRCNCYYPGDCDGSCQHPEPSNAPRNLLSSEYPPCAVCGQPLMQQHDHRPDQSGLDDGPYLPGKAPRQNPAPKSDAETQRIRADAWATRRQKYGLHGHR